MSEPKWRMVLSNNKWLFVTTILYSVKIYAAQVSLKWHFLLFVSKASFVKVQILWPCDYDEMPLTWTKNRRTSSWFMLLCSLVPLYFVVIFFYKQETQHICINRSKGGPLQTVPDRKTPNWGPQIFLKTSSKSSRPTSLFPAAPCWTCWFRCSWPLGVFLKAMFILRMLVEL